MNTQSSQTKPPRGEGFASLIMGIVTLSIYSLYLGVLLLFSVLGGSNPGPVLAGLGEAFGILSVPFVCSAMAANVVGSVLGILALRRTPAESERRFAIRGLVMNLLPILLWLSLAIYAVINR